MTRDGELASWLETAIETEIEIEIGTEAENEAAAALHASGPAGRDPIRRGSVYLPCPRRAGARNTKRASTPIQANDEPMKRNSIRLLARCATRIGTGAVLAWRGAAPDAPLSAGLVAICVRGRQLCHAPVALISQVQRQAHERPNGAPERSDVDSSRRLPVVGDELGRDEGGTHQISCCVISRSRSPLHRCISRRAASAGALW